MMCQDIVQCPLSPQPQSFHVVDNVGCLSDPGGLINHEEAGAAKIHGNDLKEGKRMGQSYGRTVWTVQGPIPL